LNEGINQAHHVVQLASEKQASDILLLDIRQLNSFADFFVLLTADNRRQMNMLVEELDKALSKDGARLYHREGIADSGWILLDFGDVVVHILGQEEREFYGLERLWSQAIPLVKIQ
jgi:ribosome-associated protein